MQKRQVILEPMGQVQSCPICCMNYQHLSKFHCGHSCCQNCMSLWVQEIFNRQNLSSDTLISCPNRCGADIPYEELREQIQDQALFAKIEQLYTLKYIRHADDVVICPSPGCTYGGFIKQSSCKEPLQCEKCHNTWRDPSSFSCWERLVSKGEGEQWTNLKKVLFTVACPSCGMFISKNGGCQYMRCAKCQYEFCWFCQQSYKGYRHQNPGYMCPQRIWMLFCIYFLVFFSSNYKVGIYYPSLLAFECQCCYWLAVVVADCFTIGLGVFLPGGILLNRAPWIRYAYRKLTWISFLKRAALQAVLTLAGVALLWFASTFTQNMIWLALHFAAVMAILGACFFLLFMLFKFAMKSWVLIKNTVYPIMGWKIEVEKKHPRPEPKFRKYRHKRT